MLDTLLKITISPFACKKRNKDVTSIAKLYLNREYDQKCFKYYTGDINYTSSIKKKIKIKHIKEKNINLLMEINEHKVTNQVLLR